MFQYFYQFKYFHYCSRWNLTNFIQTTALFLHLIYTRVHCDTKHFSYNYILGGGIELHDTCCNTVYSCKYNKSIRKFFIWYDLMHRIKNRIHAKTKKMNVRNSPHIYTCSVVRDRIPKCYNLYNLQLLLYVFIAGLIVCRAIFKKMHTIIFFEKKSLTLIPSEKKWLLQCYIEKKSLTMGKKTKPPPPKKYNCKKNVCVTMHYCIYTMEKQSCHLDKISNDSNGNIWTDENIETSNNVLHVRTTK